MNSIVCIHGLLMRVSYETDEQNGVAFNTVHLVDANHRAVGPDISSLLDSLYFMHNDTIATPILGTVVDQLMKEHHEHVH